MAPLDVRQKAARIVELFRGRQHIEILPAEFYPRDLDEAYAIRQAFQQIEETSGRGAVAGYKIGLTTPVMQKLCGVDEPCYGAIFTREVHHRRAELAATDYCRLGVETEIAFRLGADLPQGGAPGEIAAAVESCMAVIELIEDLHYDYKRLDAAALVAGNVWNAGVVLGTPVTGWRNQDLARATARLSINGQEIGSGNGGDVMGHPLNALAWLADKLAAAGNPLRRGMIVMTGSMVPIQYPVVGDRVVIEVSGLGTAELVLS
jgi:2-oxo-3-hexenedioate decarboxylase/2-keto-4-pentenoate hydratase